MVTMMNSQRPSTFRVDLLMMDALSQAERLAYERRDLSAIVYARPTPVSQDVVSGRASPVTLFVRLSDQPAPEGATVLTSVTRRACEVSGVSPPFGAVVRQVLANLPAGVELADRAVIEYYPRKPYDAGRQVFAYEFMSTAGLNVATWIPDVSLDGAQMQPGFEGRGRPWKSGSIDGEPTIRLDEYIADAKRSELCRHVLGWWAEAQHDTTGERGERNLYERAPDFIVAAESGRPDSELVPKVLAWWGEAQFLATGERGERNVFVRAPRFVELAESMSPAEPEPAPRRMRP
jgi:hypothetical protein